MLTKTNQGKTNWSWVISSGGTTAENYNVDGVNAVKLTRTSDASFTWHYISYSGLIKNLIEPNTKYTLSFDVKPSVNVTFSASLVRGDWSGSLTDLATMNKATANQWTKVSCILTSKTTLPDALGQVVYLQGMPVATGNWLIIKNIKLEKGVVLSDWSPATEDYDSKLASAQSEIKQTTNAIKASVSSLDNSTVKSSSLTINSDGIVMKAGKSTTDVANAIGSYFAVNQNAINLFADKIKVKGNMIVAGSLTADMIAGGQLRSTNGATVFNLNAGTLTFNNNSGYIQRVANNKIFEITTYLGKSLVDSQDYLTSAFNIRKSDNSRWAGIQFSLYNTLDNQPTATAKINSDSLNLYDSKNTRLFSVNGRSAYMGNFNIQGWGDIPVAQVYGGLIVKDIGIGGHIKPLLKIVEELCKKNGITWI